MKMITFRSFFFVSILIIVLINAYPAFAHGDEPRLEISPDNPNPGSILDIRGVDFELDEEILLTLVGSQSEVALGSAIADAEGIFMLTVTLPTDLVEGTYVIRAKTDDHTLDSSPITIWGSANLGGGEEGQRSEEDGLLAPMPTFIRGTVPDNGVAQSTLQVPQPIAQSTIKTGGGPLMVVLILLCVGMLAIFSIRMIRRTK